MNCVRRLADHVVGICLIFMQYFYRDAFDSEYNGHMLPFKQNFSWKKPTKIQIESNET